MNPRTYSAAILGLGRIAWKFDEDPRRPYVATHAAGYTRHPRFQLVGAADPDLNQRAEFHARYSTVPLFSDPTELFNSVRPEIVSICAPPQTHADLLHLCIDRAVPLIFCEKPLVLNSTELKALERKLQGARSRILVNHSRRFDPVHRTLAERMRALEFGEMMSWSAFYTAGIRNTGSHLIDLLLWFFGEPDSVTAWPRVGSSISAEAGAIDPDLNAVFRYRSGMIGALNALNVKDYLIFEIDAYGSKGRFRIRESGKRIEIHSTVESPHFSGYRELSPHETMTGGLSDMMMTALTHAADILDHETVPWCGFPEGRAAVEWIDRICAEASATFNRRDYDSTELIGTANVRREA